MSVLSELDADPGLCICGCADSGPHRPGLCELSEQIQSKLSSLSPKMHSVGTWAFFCTFGCWIFSCSVSETDPATAALVLGVEVRKPTEAGVSVTSVKTGEPGAVAVARGPRITLGVRVAEALGR